MRWQPYSYNGHVIHGTAYAAKGGAGAMDMMLMPASDAQFVGRGLGVEPKYTGSERRPREFTVTVTRIGTSLARPTAAQVGDMAEELNGWFYSSTEGTLIVQDLDDSSKEYYIKCVPVGAPNFAFPVMEYQFAAADPRFYEVVSGTASFNLTASGKGGTVTVNGNVNSQPVIAVMATGAKTGQYAYKVPIVTYNRAAKTLTNYPVDLTTPTTGGTAWSLAAAVSGGTVQADMDDVRLFDGAEKDRWLGGNGAGTLRVFGNMDYAPYTQLIVNTAVSASGTPTAITFKQTAANKDNLKAMPSTGEVYNPATGERITYSAKNASNYVITPQYRGVKGSSAGTIPTGGTLVWLDHPDVWAAYGNASAEAPVTDDTKKPIFNLTNSTNVSWDYDYFSESAYGRSGAWKPAVSNATSTGVYRETRYTTAEHMTDAAPSEEMGMVIGSYQKNGIWKADDATVEWRWYNPVGGTIVTTTGENYRTSTSWPALAALQKSRNGQDWTTVVNQTTPGTASTWGAWLPAASGTALGGTYEHLRYALRGSVRAGSGNLAAMELSDVTIGLDTSKTPFVARGAEQANYQMAAKITNTTTGEYITLSGPVAINRTVTIDCAAQTVTYDDGTDLTWMLETSTSRDEWFDLIPGANVFTYEDTGMGNLTIAFIVRDVIV